MVSIWPNMQGDGPNQLEMRKQGFLLGDDSTHDARQEDARTLYWEQTQEGYFRFGVDAWWADCTEPFEADWKGAVKPGRAQRMKINVDEQKKYLDPEYVNSYSLLHSKGIYQGQRAANPGKRVLLLTRSASLGQQRYGVVTWFGDINATWQTLRRQIADGLNFCLTGNPRWNFDIGAFFVGSRDDLWFWKGDFPGGVDDLGYRELYVRWLQTGTFLPQMRAHGTETPRESWRFGEPGDDTYDVIVAFIRLRYRLLPYLYSLQAWETSRHYTSMRALAFDFRHDKNTHDIDDQFMLGPTLMVCPVTEAMQFGPGSRPIENSNHSRRVYLPAGSDWYDFWTGQKYSGGQQIEMATPLEIVPLLVGPGQSCRWARWSNTPRRPVRGPWNYGSTPAPTAASSCTTMPATDTATKAASAPPRSWGGMTRPDVCTSARAPGDIRVRQPPGRRDWWWSGLASVLATTSPRPARWLN